MRREEEVFGRHVDFSLLFKEMWRFGGRMEEEEEEEEEEDGGGGLWRKMLFFHDFFKVFGGGQCEFPSPPAAAVAISRL